LVAKLASFVVGVYDMVLVVVVEDEEEKEPVSALICPGFPCWSVGVVVVVVVCTVPVPAERDQFLAPYGLWGLPPDAI